MRNGKIIIPIIIGAIVVLIGVIAVSNQEYDKMEVEDTLDREIKPNDEIAPEIQEKIDEISKASSENEYTPKPREWVSSGPFEIDRSEYVLGEKIFLRMSNLAYDEKGQIAFLRPQNDTHYSVYWTIPFDGTDKESFNYYIQPQLAKTRGLCTVDDFVGEWRVVFRGTDYENLEFRITEDILPGDEDNYRPVC